MEDAIFRNPIQIGLLVKDLDKALKNFKTVLGMDQFRIAQFPPEGCEDAVREYHGEKGDFTAKFCFYDWGNVEFEIIQPLSGRTIWSDFLERKGDMALHHIKFLVDHHSPAREHFEKLGIEASQKGEGVGPNQGREWVFYHTEELLGFDLELLNRIRD